MFGRIYQWNIWARSFYFLKYGFNFFNRYRTIEIFFFWSFLVNCVFQAICPFHLNSSLCIIFLKILPSASVILQSSWLRAVCEELVQPPREIPWLHLTGNLLCLLQGQTFEARINAGSDREGREGYRTRLRGPHTARCSSLWFSSISIEGS